MSVQPDLGIRHSPVEFDGEIFVLRTGGQREPLAIPACAERWQASNMRIDIAVEGAFDRPVVRQSNGAPLGVIEVRIFCPVDLAFVESPAGIEGLPSF